MHLASLTGSSHPRWRRARPSSGRTSAPPSCTLWEAVPSKCSPPSTTIFLRRRVHTTMQGVLHADGSLPAAHAPRCSVYPPGAQSARRRLRLWPHWHDLQHAEHNVGRVRHRGPPVAAVPHRLPSAHSARRRRPRSAFGGAPGQVRSVTVLGRGGPSSARLIFDNPFLQLYSRSHVAAFPKQRGQGDI